MYWKSILNGYSNENYSIQGNIGVQKVFKSDDWVKYYAKPSISYGLDDNLALHGGLGLYYTDYQESDNNVETRPYLGISHFYTLSEKWKLSAYLRVEIPDTTWGNSFIRFKQSLF